MANETDSAAFARDLGYLDKFFANLNTHAATLPPAQGARLKQLVGEEVVRWQEIRQLITGQAVAAPTQASMATTQAPAPAPAPSPTASLPAASSGPQKVRVTYTVGSLLGQPK